MMLQNKHPFLALILIALLAVLTPTAEAQQIALAVPQERTTLMEYVVKNRPVLANLLTKSGLAPLLSGSGPLTLLAPPESALQSITQESPERLRAILSAHILKGAYPEKSLRDGADLPSVEGTKVIVCRKKEHTLVNGVRIEQEGLQLKNGVLLELDGMFRM